MKKLAIPLVIAMVLAIIGCQLPQDVVRTEQLDAVKQELTTLKSDFTALKAAFDSLKADYTAHLDQHHKIKPKPPVGERGGGTDPERIGR